MNCKLCNSLIETTYSYLTDMCFSCDYWVKLSRHPGQRVVTKDYTHYIIGPETNAPSQTKGYGGRKFTIKFSDGTTVKTTNLRYQGVIPEHLRHLYTVNVEAVSETGGSTSP